MSHATTPTQRLGQLDWTDGDVAAGRSVFMMEYCIRAQIVSPLCCCFSMPTTLCTPIFCIESYLLHDSSIDLLHSAIVLQYACPWSYKQFGGTCKCRMNYLTVARVFVCRAIVVAFDKIAIEHPLSHTSSMCIVLYNLQCKKRTYIHWVLYVYEYKGLQFRNLFHLICLAAALVANNLPILPFIIS